MSLLIGTATALAMRAYLTDQLDDDVRASRSSGRTAARDPGGRTTSGRWSDVQRPGARHADRGRRRRRRPRPAWSDRSAATSSALPEEAVDELRSGSRPTATCTRSTCRSSGSYRVGTVDLGLGPDPGRRPARPTTSTTRSCPWSGWSCWSGCWPCVAAGGGRHGRRTPPAAAAARGRGHRPPGGRAAAVRRRDRPVRPGARRTSPTSGPRSARSAPP